MADVIFERCEVDESDIPEGFRAYKVKKSSFMPFAANFKLLEALLKMSEKEHLLQFKGNDFFGAYYIVSKETEKIMCIVYQTPFFTGFLVPEKEPQAGFSLVDKVYAETGISYLVRG
jgi:hypothetical protein